MSKHNRKNAHLSKIGKLKEDVISEKIDLEIQKSEYEKTCPNADDEKIRQYFSDKNIIWITQEINHDGYDIYGPKSNLYDLYFVEKIENQNKYALYHYHTENWYDRREDYKIYSLYRKKIVNEIDINIDILSSKEEIIKYIKILLFSK